MTDPILNEWRERVNAVRGERGVKKAPSAAFDPKINTFDEAACRLIEEHHAFRREVSDAVRHNRGNLCSIGLEGVFDQFIIPNPDPLTDVAAALGTTREALADALAKAGAKIEEVK